MKNKNTGWLVLIVAGLIIAGLFAYDYFSEKKTLKENEFRDYRKEFRHEIDSIKNAQILMQHNQDTMRTNQSDIKNNQSGIKSDLDSLKKGQNVIYDHITNPKKNSKTNFKDLVKW